MSVKIQAVKDRAVPVAAAPTDTGGKKTGIAAWLAAALILVLLAYANHFNNSFHFDDGHTITENPWLRDLQNIPRFFTDGNTFSTLPANRSYRPLVSTSLAIDYWLGHGLAPPWFHISTFFWFLIQLTLMFLLFGNILNRIGTDPLNRWIALFAAALYGVHPAIAETVNYIIQRGDLYSTLGVVASLVLYFAFPRQRARGFYLAPFALALLAKPPALVLPLLLMAWLVLIDRETTGTALRKCVPAMIIAGVMAWFTTRMTPPSFSAGGVSAYSYLITQPSVLLHYFTTFFIPAGLSADTDKAAYAGLPQADLAGFLFIPAIVSAIVYCGRRSARAELHPIAFGLCWFLIASLPTSLFPLAEVENDHRMFFPFVGLTLSVSWAAALFFGHWKVPRRIMAVAGVLVLVGFAWGVRERNRVWRTEESLWRDVTVKSPKNGRGWMNYGLSLMARADYAGALESFVRASPLTPNYYILEVNLGIVNGELMRPAEAERHFARAIELAPTEAVSHFYVARWLNKVGRAPEAVSHLKAGIEVNPDYIDSRYLLMQICADTGDAAGLQEAAQQTLARFPADVTAASWLVRARSVRPAALTTPATNPGADEYLSQSLTFFQTRQYGKCIAAARKLLEIQPDSSAAWNNIGACYNGLSDWDNGILAEEHALRLQPDFQIAKNNLAWAQAQKASAAAAKGNKARQLRSGVGVSAGFRLGAVREDDVALNEEIHDEKHSFRQKFRLQHTHVESGGEQRDQAIGARSRDCDKQRVAQEFTQDAAAGVKDHAAHTEEVKHHGDAAPDQLAGENVACTQKEDAEDQVVQNRCAQGNEREAEQHEINPHRIEQRVEMGRSIAVQVDGIDGNFANPHAPRSALQQHVQFEFIALRLQFQKKRRQTRGNGTQAGLSVGQFLSGHKAHDEARSAIAGAAAKRHGI